VITVIERSTHRATTVLVPSTPNAGKVSLTTIGRRGPPGAAATAAISNDPGNLIVAGSDGRLYVSPDRLDDIELIALAGL
jgi:hypothetical protein